MGKWEGKGAWRFAPVVKKKKKLSKRLSHGARGKDNTDRLSIKLSLLAGRLD